MKRSENIDINPAKTLDAMMIPWSYNASNKPDSEILWTQYDHFTCLMIELLFRRYMDGDKTY